MHDRDTTEADVTEGSGGVWERLHYDWSDPRHVVLTTTDSNAWGGHSGFLGVVLGSVGKGVLKKAFVNSVTAIEARTNGANVSVSASA